MIKRDVLLRLAEALYAKHYLLLEERDVGCTAALITVRQKAAKTPLNMGVIPEKRLQIGKRL